MATAIELYKEAYNLDFRNGDLNKAEALYNRIIEKFPQAEERVYAEVHLERIYRLKQDMKNPTLHSHQQKTGINGFLVFNFLLTLLIFAVLGYGAIFIWTQHKENIALSLVINGRINESEEIYGNAIENYVKAATISPKLFLPHECLAKLYYMQGELELAKIEAEQWKRYSLEKETATNFIAKITE